MNAPWLNDGVRTETTGREGRREKMSGTVSVSRRTDPGGAPSAAVLQSTIPDYRVPVFAALRERLPDGLTIVCGETDFSENVRIGADLGAHVLVENVFLADRRLLWQRRTVRRLTRPRSVMLELNPRIVNTWLILVLRRLRGRRSVVFGHAWPRRGPTARTDRVRHLMRRLADAVVVYTDSQARELAALMPRHEIYAAPNALYPRSRAVRDAEHRPATDVLYVGRLVDAKKPGLLLEAFERAVPSLPEHTRLVVVGDGPLRPELEAKAGTTAVRERVQFLGHVADFETLKTLYARALVSVSPGYVGLSLTQSRRFGVPVLIARDEPHSPEVEAAESGWNALFFASDSPDALCASLLDVFAARDHWVARAPAIAEACVTRYSLESMVEALARALEGT